MRDLWLEAIRIREEGGDHAVQAWFAALTPDEQAALGAQGDQALAAMREIARIVRPDDPDDPAE
jgi:hypothetical protein